MGPSDGRVERGNRNTPQQFSYGFPIIKETVSVDGKTLEEFKGGFR